MTPSGEETVRQLIDVINRNESADAVMKASDDLFDPEIEWINPADALEVGTRRGRSGVRTAFENLYAGAGSGAMVELEEVRERGARVFVRGRLHARGSSSGAEVASPPGGLIFTIRDGRILSMEWHFDPDEALARFERPA